MLIAPSFPKRIAEKRKAEAGKKKNMIPEGLKSPGSWRAGRNGKGLGRHRKSTRVLTIDGSAIKRSAGGSWGKKDLVCHHQGENVSVEEKRGIKNPPKRKKSVARHSQPECQAVRAGQTLGRKGPE